MAEISESVRRGGQRILSTLLRAIADVSQVRVADRVGISESSLSDFKREHMERLCFVIAAAQLNVVDASAKNYTDQEIEALLPLAAIGLKELQRRAAEKVAA